MGKIKAYETESERYRRERSNAIVKEYLDNSREILTGEVTPNRVMNYLADRFGMSEYGVKTVLKRMGIYKSAQQPIVIPREREPRQLTMQFSNDSNVSGVARVAVK